MSIKLKVLGLGLLAVIATSAFAVMNASAVSGGHFVHHNPSSNLATIEGTEVGTDKLHFVREGAAPEEQIGCDKDKYHGTVSAKTVTEVKIVPEWSECTTTRPDSPTFEIHENGCYFVFTSGKTGQTHHTAHLICPDAAKPYIEITHPSCSIRVPGQTTQGVTYAAAKVPNTNIDGITLTSTTKGITSHYESGICIFLGTTQKSEMVGSVLVEGREHAAPNALINLTSTTG